MSAPAQQLTPLGHALAGALGGVVSNALVYPLDTIKTRIQGTEDDASISAASSSTPSARSPRSRKSGMLALLLRIWKKEGLSGFFKGFGANMLNTFSMQFAYFFFHTFLRSFVLKRLNRSRAAGEKLVTQLSTASELLLGALAGALAQIFTIPVAVIATRQQLYEPDEKNPHARSPSLLETAREILDESGPTGLWKGLKPGLVLTVNPAITYGVFERVKGAWIAAAEAKTGQARLSPVQSFTLGVFSKTLATVATYPYIFAKVRLQAKQQPSESAVGSATSKGLSSAGGSSYAAVAAAEPPHRHGEHVATSEDIEANTAETKTTSSLTQTSLSSQARPKSLSAIEILRLTYVKKGLVGWYQGMQAQILKAVLSQGILFLLKDQFEAYALMIMLVARRLLRQQ